MKKNRVYISCTSADRQFARRLYGDLKRAGVQPWMSNEDIPAGGDIRAEIHRALKTSDYFLPVLSENMTRGPEHAHRELNLALDLSALYPAGEIFIIPVKIDTSPVDYRLEGISCADFSTSYDDGLGRVLAVLAPEITVEDILRRDLTKDPDMKNDSSKTDNAAFRMQLVDLFLKCRAMADRNSRDAVVDELRSDIRHTVKRSDVNRVDVVQIITRCMDFHDGLEELLEKIKFFEGSADCIKPIEKQVRRFQG